jgi:hypothetical protein
MAIVAEAGGRQVRINVARPSWADMYKNYPAENVRTDELYNTIIKGTFLGKEKAPWLTNTCSIRMSHALNKSGVLLGKAPSEDGTMKGPAGNYWIRVKDLQRELEKRFNSPDMVLTHRKMGLTSEQIALHEHSKPVIDRAVLDERIEAGKNFVNKISNERGIIAFNVEGWGDASGHFTLWNGQKLLFVDNPIERGSHNDLNSSEYYFWFYRIVYGKQNPHALPKWIFQRTNTVNFWALK